MLPPCPPPIPLPILDLNRKFEFIGFRCNRKCITARKPKSLFAFCLYLMERSTAFYYLWDPSSVDSRKSDLPIHEKTQEISHEINSLPFSLRHTLGSGCHGKISGGEVFAEYIEY